MLDLFTSNSALVFSGKEEACFTKSFYSPALSCTGRVNLVIRNLSSRSPQPLDLAKSISSDIAWLTFAW